MRQVYKRCAGLDVHKKTVVACRVQIDEQGEWQQEVRTFGTMTCELLQLVDWLLAGEVTHVALESTGEYWKPVYNLLEGNAEVVLVTLSMSNMCLGARPTCRMRMVGRVAGAWSVEGQLHSSQAAT